MKYITLNTEQKMPVIGLGTWKSASGEVYQAIRWALKLGYTHFDCAQIYKNQEEIGAALHDAMAEDGIKREDLFITSKIWNDAHAPQDVIPAVKRILAELRLEYLDLLLMHWPVAQRKGTEVPQSAADVISLKEEPLELTWAEMEKAQRQGLAKAIGVSNFGPENLSLLLEKGEIAPAVNQVESHPYLQQTELLEFCRKNNIALTAYSPLGSSDRAYKAADEPSLLKDPTVQEVAERNNITPAQVLLGWQIERGVIVIPKSTREEHMRQNLAALSVELDAEDMKKIDAIVSKYRYITGQSFAYGDYTPETIFA